MNKADLKKLHKRIGERINEARVRVDLTQEALVAALPPSDRITVGYLSALENGRRAPSLPLLIEFGRILGRKLDYFVADEES